MKKTKLESIPKNGTGSLHIRDEVQDNLSFEGYSLSVCRFESLGLKKAEFKNSKITQCLFDFVYLRLAQFLEVDFTRTTVRNCNLDRATFQSCKLQYCRFENTVVDPHEIEACLPPEPNLRRDLARNLRKNFESLGDQKSADIFLDHEINAEEEELWSRFTARTSYYKNKYNPFDRLAALGKWSAMKLSGIVWGHGYRIRRLIASYVIATFVLALISYFFHFEFRDIGGSSRALSFWEANYQAFAETLGSMTTPFVPESWFARALQVVERFVGTLMLALLAAAAYRRVAR